MTKPLTLAEFREAVLAHLETMEVPAAHPINSPGAFCTYTPDPTSGRPACLIGAFMTPLAQKLADEETLSVVGLYHDVRELFPPSLSDIPVGFLRQIQAAHDTKVGKWFATHPGHFGQWLRPDIEVLFDDA